MISVILFMYLSVLRKTIEIKTDSKSAYNFFDFSWMKSSITRFIHRLKPSTVAINKMMLNLMYVASFDHLKSSKSVGIFTIIK